MVPPSLQCFQAPRVLPRCGGWGLRSRSDLVVGSRPQVSSPVKHSNVSVVVLLTNFSYTDTDLDPYNAERGFWWVSGNISAGFRVYSFLSTVSRRLDAREAKNKAWTSRYKRPAQERSCTMAVSALLRDRANLGNYHPHRHSRILLV
jgi:hypothetical protein